MTNARVPPSGLRRIEIIVILGALHAFAPLSIDMYLPSLPVLEKVFGASAAEVQRTLSSFFAGFSIGQAFYGPVTDRFGRKRPLFCSLLLFIAASAACARATSAPEMVVLRFLQALGACGSVVIARAVVRDLFPLHETRRVFSAMLLVTGVAPMVGPLVGSYLLSAFGWTAAFWVMTAIGVACLAGVFFRLPESHDASAAHPLELGRTLSTYAFLFRDPVFLGAALVGGCASAGLFTYIAGSPFVFMNVFHLPVQTYGWVFALNATGIVICSQINGHVLHSANLRRVLRYANLGQFAAAVLLVVATASGRGGLYGVVVPLYVYVGLVGFVFPNATALAMADHPKIAGMASALIGTAQFGTGAVASAILGLMGNTSALPMALLIAACAALGVLFNVLMLRERAPQSVLAT